MSNQTQEDQLGTNYFKGKFMVCKGPQAIRSPYCLLVEVLNYRKVLNNRGVINKV